MRKVGLSAIAAFFSVSALIAFGCTGSEDTIQIDTNPPAPDGGGDPPDAAPPPPPPPMDASPPPPPPDESTKVFNLGKLQGIEINIEAQYINQIENDTENYVPCQFKFNSVVLDNCGCRKKGGYGSVASIYGKTGFTVKFNAFVPGQDLYGLTKLNLNNAQQDPSFLNEHLGYEVYRRMGIPASRTAHGMLRFNGQTKGLFVIAESVDKKFLAANFGEGKENGNLYEAPAWTDFVDNPMGLELKDEIEEMRVRDDIIAFSQFVQSSDAATFAANLPKHVDVNGFITGYAIDAIFNHWDGYSYVVINNYFMYREPTADRFVFMPHGMDQLFQDLNFNVDSWPNGKLSQRIRQDPVLDKQFHDSIMNVLNTAWDVPSLVARVDQVDAVLKTNTNMDQAALNDLNSFNNRVADVRFAIAYRKSILTGEPLNNCGNKVIEPTEFCDDGNTVTGDGCSSTCFNENCTKGTYLGKNYMFCPDTVVASQGAAECKGYGGTLAVPLNATENAWVTSTALGIAGQNWWIGLNDEQNDGVYLMPSGEVASYFAWGVGKPNGGTSQNCVVLDAADSGKWNDKACGDQGGAVCLVP